METATVKINGKKYLMTHPGAKAYFKKKKLLNQITTDGYIQWDESALFDFAFGKNAQDARVVSTDAGAWVNWADAGLVEDDKTPTLSELSEVWAIILPGFLSNGSRAVSDDKSWEWVDNVKPGNDNTNKKPE